jgi:hypothetical protein
MRRAFACALCTLVAPFALVAHGQDAAGGSPRTHAADSLWIRPADTHGPAVWGIRNGIVFSLWPHDVETGWPRSRIRPRGLIRIGYEQNGLTYLINFVAVEPVVAGKIEYSEISPSSVDRPQQPEYLARWNWRYRPFFSVTQYWRKDGDAHDPSLQVRVNGRARYWAGGSRDPAAYIAIPGGVSFENFEMRENYAPGQKFYFGITRRSPEEIVEAP